MQNEKLKILFTSQQATFNHSHSKTEQSFLRLLHCDVVKFNFLMPVLN